MDGISHERLTKKLIENGHECRLNQPHPKNSSAFLGLPNQAPLVVPCARQVGRASRPTLGESGCRRGRGGAENGGRPFCLEDTTIYRIYY